MATLEEFYFDYMEVLDCRLLCDLPALREVYLRGARAWHEAAPEALARLREVCVRIETSSELDAEIDRIVVGRAREAVAVKLAAAGLDDLADLWKLHGPTYRRDDASMLHILVDRIHQDPGSFEDFRCADLVRSMVAVGVDTARMWDTRETAIWGMVETETKLCDTFDALMDICFPSRRTATSTTDDGEG